MLKINDYIKAYIPKDYGNHLPDFPVELDCSLGVNSEELPDAVFARLKELRGKKQNIIKQYPRDEVFLEKLAVWYNKQGIPWLKKDNFIPGNGSFDLLCNLNLLCLSGQKKVLGHAPQFTAYVDHVNCIGAEYCAYTLDPEKNYRFGAEAYLAAMNPSYDLFIIENPNNPTGQEIGLEDIKKIAAKAESLNTVLIVDEAYGDYLEPANSAINLVNSFSNVVVTRSFSKSFGMAGIRLGYAVAPAPRTGDVNGIVLQLQKLQIPFSCNSIARFLGEAVLDYLSGSRADFLKIHEIEKNKQKILDSLTTLRAAETSMRTPIITLYYQTPGAGFNLQRFLEEKAGLSTVSCASYEGLDRRAVRLMLPRTRDVDEKLIPMLKKAQQLLS